MTPHPEPRPALPWPYIAILLAEICILGRFVATSHGRPPRFYEVGWAGVGSMFVMQLYSIRRRVRALHALGSLRAWLDLHVFLGLQSFIFVAYHSVGVSPQVTLAAVNFALVTTIVATGLFGRFIYNLIPRARAEDALAYAELGATVLRGMSPPAALRRECRGVVDLIGLDLLRRRLLRQLLRDPAVTPIHARAARRSMLLASRISALEIAERWCSRWILLHRPLAFLLLGITALHVLAHFAYAV
ncbi:MAG TPA: hypothetical protein VGC42_24640 [Kofleriaceae bacterium]